MSTDEYWTEETEPITDGHSFECRDAISTPHGFIMVNSLSSSTLQFLSANEGKSLETKKGWIDASADLEKNATAIVCRYDLLLDYGERFSVVGFLVQRHRQGDEMDFMWLKGYSAEQ